MRTFLLLALLALAACSVRGADPYVGYLYPAGLKAGTTNRVVVCGQFFWNIRDFDAGEGVHVVSWEMVPGFPVPTGDQRRYLVKWLDGIAKGDRTQPRLPVENEHYNEWRSNRWYNALGDLDRGQIELVERFLFIPRNALQMTPALSQKILVTLAVDADAKPGPREFRVFGMAGASPPRPLVVTAEPHRAEPPYEPPHRRQPAPPVVDRIPCVLDGQVMPGETDLWKLPLAKGRTVTLRVTARELQPYIGDAVPGFFNAVLRVTDPDGREVAFADDDFHHPDPVLTFTAPADGVYTLEIRDNLYRGREDFVYAVEVRDGAVRPPLRDRSLMPSPDWSVPADALVAEVHGVVDRPGRRLEHDFEVPKAGDYCFDVLARRAGSPLDARLTVWKGDVCLARIDDVTNTVHVGNVIQAECDPVGRVRLDAPGRYTARLEDEAGKGGPEYGYDLRIHRPRPRFEVWCRKSGFTLRSWNGGAPVEFEVIRRDGFDGSVHLEANGLVRFGRAEIPPASNRVSTTIVSLLKRPAAPTNLTLTASAVVDGRREQVLVVPANEYNQAFAWDHLVPARRFVLKSVPGNPPKPKAQPSKAQPPKAQPKKPAPPAKK